eukprot:SAG25_NODE_197_length_12126_cov_39.030515_4_plen_194_part_00
MARRVISAVCDTLVLTRVSQAVLQHTHNHVSTCSTSPSGQWWRLIEQHLRFHPNLRILFVSCRIVHALDIKSDLDERFPMGSSFEFTLYNDREQNSAVNRIVVQLNSTNQYSRTPAAQPRITSWFWTRSSRRWDSSRSVTARCAACDTIVLLCHRPHGIWDAHAAVVYLFSEGTRIASRTARCHCSSLHPLHR